MPERIIHVAQDEKFIDSAYRQFEQTHPGINRFYIVTKEPGFRHVTPHERVFKSSVAEILEQVVPSLSKSDVVIIHSLNDQFIPVVLALPKDVPCVWFCFGYEIYNDRHFYSENDSMDTLTRRHFAISDIPLKIKLREFLQPLLRIFRPGLPLLPIEAKRKAIARMDYLASSFEEEFQSIQKLAKIRKKYFSYWVYPIENTVDVNHPALSGRPDILVGNSGHATGNHMDVFKKIKDYDFGNRKVVTPLSYGNPAYIGKILPYGKSVLGAAFEPLTDFYPLDQYNDILRHCGIAILNCRRQQAVGNTIALLWFGSKVFLSDKNPFFHYLRRIGIKVFSYESDLNEESCNALLSDADIAQNRKALLDNLNAALLLHELKSDIDKIHTVSR